MNSTSVALLAALFTGACVAQTSPAPASPSAPAAARTASTTAAPDDTRERGEPEVKRSRVEDDGVRIDELRVRGQTQRVVVTPKGGGKPYEIIMGNAGQALPDGTGGANSAVGKRVWTMLSF